MEHKIRIDILRDNIDRRQQHSPMSEFHAEECNKWQAEIDELLTKQQN
jgi:hypothetical protein